MQDPISTPEAFFTRIVEPDVSDFIADQGNIRLAFHACMSLNHLNDWVAKARGEEKGQLSQRLYAQCAALKQIRDISINCKHFPPDDGTEILTIGASAKAITLDEIKNISLDDMLGTLDAYGASPQILIQGSAGKNWMTLLINEAYVFWKRWFSAEDVARSSAK